MEYLNPIINFFNHPFFIIIGGLSTASMALAIFVKIFSVIFGVTPLAWRFSLAVWDKKIGIIASEEGFQKIIHEIKSSSLVKEKNISRILISNIEDVRKKGLLVVDYEHFKDLKSLVPLRKSSQAAIIVLAKPGQIPSDEMSWLSDRSNIIVTNFFGRLLNDMVVSMVSTSLSE